MDQNTAAHDLLLSVECEEGLKREVNDQKGSNEDSAD